MILPLDKSWSYTLEQAEQDLSDADFADFNSLTTLDLTDEEIKAAIEPGFQSDQRQFLAIHFHPEWVPLDHISNRIKKAFPLAEKSIIIPTQHNRVMELGNLAGVEADVFAPEYNLKIQLLIHIRTSVLPKAGVLINMMDRTFRYRAGQLLDILDQIISPDDLMIREIKKTGFNHESLKAAAFYAAKLKSLITQSGILGTSRAEMLKNRLFPDFLGLKKSDNPPELMDQILSINRLVKKQVKKRLKPECFYTAREVIEEARGLGAGLIIPHPPKFWPALLDDLDVDGWEVWNPSTPDHTPFLIEAMSKKARGSKPLLAFMGDDTHMSAKIRPNYGEDKAGTEREIGVQPPFLDPKIIWLLKLQGQSLDRTLSEYQSRLA